MFAYLLNFDLMALATLSNLWRQASLI